jgi:hypothetical protein
VVDDDPGAQQRLGYRGPVAGVRVHREHLHGGLPRLPAGIEPARHHPGLPGGLAEEAAGASQIDEVGLEPLQPDPAAGGPVPGPAPSAAAGLVDAQDGERSRLSEDALGVRDEGVVHVGQLSGNRSAVRATDPPSPTVPGPRAAARRSTR